MDFIAMSFETANESRSSICEINLTTVKDGIIVSTERYLVKPYCYPYFDEANINVHGITPDRVKDSPEFPEVFKEIEGKITDKFVFFHNTGFHANVLKHTLNQYSMYYPNFPFVCTAILAKKVAPQLGIYRFDFLAKHFNIEINGKQDSKAIAELALNLTKESYGNLGQFMIQNKVLVGDFTAPDRFVPCLSKRDYSNRDNKYGLDSITSDPKTHNQDSIFYNSEVVFTGSLENMLRKDALQKIADIGGIPSDSLKTTTNYLVCGNRDLDNLTPDKMTGKYKKAISFAQKGFDVEIIDEKTFLSNL